MDFPVSEDLIRKEQIISIKFKSFFNIVRNKLTQKVLSELFISIISNVTTMINISIILAIVVSSNRCVEEGRKEKKNLKSVCDMCTSSYESHFICLYLKVI